MTTFKHGSRVTERPTSVTAPTVATSTLQVIVGTAPINTAETLENVNKAVLVYSYEEAVKALGYSEDFDNYTLCEAIDANFNLYGVAPVVFINVLDPEVHKTAGTKTVDIENKKAVINQKGILEGTVKVKLLAGSGTDLSSETDYLTSFDQTGQLVIAINPGGTIPTSQTTLYVEYDHLDAAKVTDNDIIGGYDVATGVTKGIELINSVFPRFGLVPAQLVVPKYSTKPVVEAVMKTKAREINTYFRGISHTDIPTETVRTYTQVSEWKNNNNFVSEDEIVSWPKVGLGNKIYHKSVHLAALIARTASLNGDTPHKSASNQSLNINKVVLADGTEVSLGPDQAEYVNSQGIVTALNFIGGHKSWGNNTAAFPSITDVKDAFYAVRLTHNWIANSIVLTTWSDVDDATNRSLIDGVVTKLNIWFNGLTSSNVLLGGRVEFDKADNPDTNLLAGKVKFRVYIAAPTPAQDMEFILEVDINYYNALTID